MLKSIKPKKWVVAAYLAVPVVLYVFTVFAPLVAALFYSFFEWKGGPVKTFSGLANYTQLILERFLAQYFPGCGMYHRTDRSCFHCGTADQFQGYETAGDSQNFWFLPKYNLRSLHWFYLADDL